MAYEQAQRDVPYGEAKLISLASQEWVRSRTLTIQYERIKDKRMETAVEYLDQYTSTLNDTPSFFVTNPKASDEVVDGEWALQSNTMSKGVAHDNSPEGIIQVLQEVHKVCSVGKLASLGTRVVRDQEVLNALGFGEGTQDTVNLEVPFLKPTKENEQMCMEVITEEDLADVFTPAGYTFTGRRWVVRQETHTASLFITVRKHGFRRWRPDGIHRSPDLESSTRMDNLLSGRTRTWFGIAKEDREAVLADLETDTGRIGAPEGFHVVSVDINNGGDGSVNATQTIAQRESEDTEFVNEDVDSPHDFQDGTLNRTTVRFLNYDQDELDGISVTAPSEYKEVSDQTTLNNQTGQYDRTVVFEKVTWNAWGHDAYAHDILEYSGVFSTEGKERATRTWIGIQNADMAACVADLKTGDRTLAGYSLASVNVSNRRNGAFDVSTSEREQGTLAEDHESKEVIRALGWSHCKGELTRLSLTFSGYETPAEAVAAATAVSVTEADYPGGHTFTGFREFEDGDGLHGVTYTYESVVWANDSATPTYKHVGSSFDNTALDHAKELAACALGKTNADAAFAATTTASDTDGHPSDPDRVFILVNKSLSPRGQGEFNISFNERTASAEVAESDAVLTSFTISYTTRTNFLKKTFHAERVWYRRTEAAKDELIDDSPLGSARAATFTAGGITLADAGFHVTDHHDTTYTVSQRGIADGGPVAIPVRTEDSDEAQEWILAPLEWVNLRVDTEASADNSAAFDDLVEFHWRKNFDNWYDAYLNSAVYEHPEPPEDMGGPAEDGPTWAGLRKPVFSNDRKFIVEDEPAVLLSEVLGKTDVVVPGHVTYDGAWYTAHRILYATQVFAAPVE